MFVTKNDSFRRRPPIALKSTFHTTHHPPILKAEKKYTQGKQNLNRQKSDAGGWYSSNRSFENDSTAPACIAKAGSPLTTSRYNYCWKRERHAVLNKAVNS